MGLDYSGAPVSGMRESLLWLRGSTEVEPRQQGYILGPGDGRTVVRRSLVGLERPDAPVFRRGFGRLGCWEFPVGSGWWWRRG